MITQTTCLDAGQDCRMFCRPIRTGGGEVAVRPISPADAELVQAFVTGLSGTSRYFRFFQPLKSLSPGMIDRLTRVDQVNHVALAGVAMLGGRPIMVAEVRYAVSPNATMAEIALAVADQWQRRGIATELLTTIERIAAAAGITRLTGECLAVNEPFVRALSARSAIASIRMSTIAGSSRSRGTSAIARGAVASPTRASAGVAPP